MTATAARRSALRAALSDTSASLLVFQGLTALTAFLVNIAAARVLEPSGRGELALLLQIAYLATLGVLLGTDRSVVATCSGRPAREVMLVALRLLRTPSVLLLPIAVLVLTLPVPGLADLRVGLGLAALFTVVNAVTRAVRAVSIASDRRREYLWFGAATAVLLLAVVGILAALEVRSSASWLVAYLISGLVPSVVLLLRWSCRPPVATAVPSTPAGRDDQVRLLARSRREGLALLPATVAHSGTLRIDRLLLAGLASTAALGVYATVGTMTELIAWPVIAYADSRLGRWREAHDRGALLLGRILAAATAYSVLAALVVGVAMHLALVPLLGAEYVPALELIGPLVLAAVVFGLSQLLVTALTAARRAGLASAVEVAGLVVSVVAYIVLIERAGALGAAWGSVIGYAAVGVLGATALVLTRRRAEQGGTP